MANDKNSIDVDKIDYLLRDSMMAGVKPLCDYRGLLTKCKVGNQALGQLLLNKHRLHQHS